MSAQSGGFYSVKSLVQLRTDLIICNIIAKWSIQLIDLLKFAIFKLINELVFLDLRFCRF